MPKVSIIMGIYNCEKYLTDSINSILEQTFTDWELIMCDDGSSDTTYTIASSFMKQYPDQIVLLRNVKNMGLNYTLNKCLNEARGKYVARQDGDDRSLQNRLKKEVDFLDTHQEYAFVGTNMKFFDENGTWGQSNFMGEVKREEFAIQSPFMHPTVMMRREALLDIGGYSVSKELLRVEDYHLWLKFYTHGYVGFNLEDLLYEYRDDRQAFAKRTIQNRINLFRVMQIAITELQLPVTYRIFPFKQLALILIPSALYAKIHRHKWSK